MKAATRRRRRAHAEWQALIARPAASPLPTAEFCPAEGISPASLSLWRKRLRAQAPQALEADSMPGAFLDLGVLGPTGDPNRLWELELDLGDGVTLRLRRG